MSLVDCKIDNDKLTVSLCGRVDSTNAQEVEDDIFAYLSKNESENVIVDAEKLEYISSAGLRIILKLKKEKPNLKVINANQEVYEVFEMTGFSEMMTIEKAYRKLSVEGCDVIGQGSNGKVYRLDRDTIIKVYFNSDSLPDIQRERDLARKAFVLGIPTAIPYDVVKVGDTYGSVFELLSADPFTKKMQEEPEKFDYYINLYVDLMKKIHSTEVKEGDMPDMREVVISWIKFLKDYLPEKTGEKLLSLVEAVPVKHTMLHGDYHIGNVMMQNGEVLLIDMDTLCQGHPVFELASVFNAYEGFWLLNPQGKGSFLHISSELSSKTWKETLKLYLGTNDEDKLVKVENIAKLIGVARLMRRLIRRDEFNSEEGKKTVEFYKNVIVDLVDKTDTLLF